MLESIYFKITTIIYFKHEEELRSLWKPKHLEIENIWAQLREVYNSYFEQHNPIMSHYNLLRDKDDFYQRDIAKNEIQIQQATVSIEIPP